MAFPTFAAVNNGSDTTGATSHTINLPSGISSGDLILVFGVCDGNPTLSGTLTTEYTPILNTTNGTAVRVFIYAKSATGSEGSTVALTTSASEAAIFRTARIAAAKWKGGTITTAVEVASATGASTSPDPASLNPANWATEDTLWVAGHGCDGNRTTSAYSANFSSNQYTTTVSNAANGCGLALATRENAAASEDPGTLTISNSDDWVAFTLAIRPNPIVEGAFTSADGASTASSMAGASTAAASFTSADGVSTASSMAGDTADAGRPDMPLRISRLTSSRHAGRKAGTFTPRVHDGAFVAAAGASTGETLVGVTPGIGAFSAAAGASTTSSMQGGNASGGSRDMPLRISRLTSSRHAGRKAGTFTPRHSVGEFLPAGGGSVVSSLAGSGNGSANFSAAAGTSTAASMSGQDAAFARSLNKVMRGLGIGWGTQLGVPFGRVNGSVMAAAAGVSTPATMATSLIWVASMVPAAGVATSVPRGGSSTSATSFVSAAGVSATALAGNGITALTAAAGASTTSTMVGRATVTGAFVAAAGVSTTALSGSSVSVTALVAAAGTSTAGALYGSDASANPQVGIFVPAAGVSTTGLEGSSTARANFVQADGTSTAGALLPGSISAVSFVVAHSPSTTSDMSGTNSGGTVIAASFVPALGETVTSTLGVSQTNVGSMIAAAGLTTPSAMALIASSSIKPATALVANGATTAQIMVGAGHVYVSAKPGSGGRPRREVGRRPMTQNTRRPNTGNTYRT